MTSRELPPVIILAGGLGTRLSAHFKDTPKCLAPVAGKPFLDHQLDLLAKHGITEVIISTGYQGNQIVDHVACRAGRPPHIRIVEDGDRLLGTGGATHAVFQSQNLEEAYILYGDSYLECPYAAIHGAFKNCGCCGLMTVYHNCNRYDSSNVVFQDGTIQVYDKHNKTAGMDYIDYGLSLLRRDAFACLQRQNPELDLAEPFDLTQVFTALLQAKQLAGFEVPERFYEIGTLEGWRQTDEHLKG